MRKSQALKMELQEYVSHLLPIIPDCQDAPAIHFTRDVLPAPPETLVTDMLIIQHCYHDYNDSFRADSLHLSAHKVDLRALGVLILARLFHNEHKAITLQCSHPESVVRRLVLSLPTGNKQGIFYTTTPKCFCYFVQKTSKHPWQNNPVDPWDLPMFELSNAKQMVLSEANRKNRDTLFALGSDIAHVRFAQLLLDAACPWNAVNEYELEGEAGFRGVAPASAEMRIWLPGSIGYRPPTDSVTKSDSPLKNK